ncbi:MAG: hypothetical protein BWY70_00490 [Bacteroidetes bacterium ADurb.Bin408]|nr:MAG: hypothetical protein BWY70_00490 [Bacteroidetes bacterium ADurb.Bin408]
MKKQLFCLIVILLGVFNNLLASHYMGGEITWECMQDGRFLFTMKVYRECNGIQFYEHESIYVYNHPSVTSIPMTRVSKVDISPQCHAMGPHISCDSALVPNMGAVEVNIYKSDTVFLSGVPPAQGWIFAWGSCCRNPSTSITNAASQNWVLRAVMYPYKPSGSTALNTYPCYDNSPVFAEHPTPVMCTGYPQSINYGAEDSEKDFLTYEWATPLTDFNVPINSWVAGYSYNSPLPSTVHNVNNIPAALNSYTGEITFTSFTQGAFPLVVKTTAYKNNIKTAEIFRELQVVLAACDSNNAPEIYNAVSNLPIQSNPIFNDTLTAGDFVSYSFYTIDTGLLPDNSHQTSTLKIYGSQIGTTDSTGCQNPPCAFITPAQVSSGQDTLWATLNWQTNCGHMPLQVNPDSLYTRYDFYIDVRDDFCPIPAANTKMISVHLKMNALPPPKAEQVFYDSIGQIHFIWFPITDSLGLFKKYFIYYNTGTNAPLILLDSVENINQNHFITSLPSTTLERYFVIKTVFDCDSGSGYARFHSANSDTLILYSLSQGFIERNSIANACKVYPNPAENFISFEFDKTPSLDLNFSLFDVTGRKIDHIYKITDKVLRYDCTNLNNGLYYYLFTGSKSGVFVNGFFMKNN